MGPVLPGGATKLKLGCGFGLQAEVFFFRAVGSIHGGLETETTTGTKQLGTVFFLLVFFFFLVSDPLPSSNCPSRESGLTASSGSTLTSARYTLMIQFRGRIR